MHFAPRGIILSGGPESVTAMTGHARHRWCSTWRCRCWEFAMACIPWRRSWVAGSSRRIIKEFGYARVRGGRALRACCKDIEDHVDQDGTAQLDVWMSHGDKVTDSAARALP